MKKIIIWAFALLISAPVFAQTQQGYVKTKGRLDSNGNVINGTRLSGAAITVRGRNAVVSGSNGAFSLIIPGNNYFLQNVQKQGYVLTDPDVLSKQYSYSKNPLVIVMESPSQQFEDKLEAMNKIRTTLQKRLDHSRIEIKTLKEQNKLTQEEYEKKLQELYAMQQANENLVNDMAEHYSKIDYDQFDEFNTRISRYIMDGRLREADSLLNTKGDISIRTDNLHQLQEQNAKEEAELTKRKKKLEKNKDIAQKELEDIAQDCYSKFEMFKMQHRHDSATYYIEHRASLDTTNVDWLRMAGRFAESYLCDYQRAMQFYKKSLYHATNKYGAEHTKVASAYASMSSVCRMQNKDNEAIDYATKALEINRKVFGDRHPEVSVDYHNLGLAFYAKGETQKALEYLNKAVDIKKEFWGEDHVELASIYDNLSNLYASLSKYDVALDYQKKALDLNIANYGDQSREVVTSYAGMAGLAIANAHYDEGLDYCFKAKEIMEKQNLENHVLYANICNQISQVYSLRGDYQNGLLYANKALDRFRELFGENHSLVAFSCQDIAYAYSYLGDNEKSLEYNLKALDILKSIGANDNNMSQAYNNVGYLSYMSGKYQDALDYHKLALSQRTHAFGEKSADAAQSYDNIGMVQFALGDYQQAMESHQKALSIRKEVQGEQHPELAWSYIGIGDVLAATGKYEDALTFYEKAYVVRKDGIGEKHPDTILCKQKIEETKQKITNHFK